MHTYYCGSMVFIPHDDVNANYQNYYVDSFVNRIREVELIST